MYGILVEKAFVLSTKNKSGPQNPDPDHNRTQIMIF